MDESLWGLMTIVGPLLLLAVLIWAFLRNRRDTRPSDKERTEQATRDLYETEERRHREGTDGL